MTLTLRDIPDGDEVRDMTLARWERMAREGRASLAHNLLKSDVKRANVKRLAAYLRVSPPVKGDPYGAKAFAWRAYR